MFSSAITAFVQSELEKSKMLGTLFNEMIKEPGKQSDVQMKMKGIS